jgi:hypothetical protein
MRRLPPIDLRRRRRAEGAALSVFGLSGVVLVVLGLVAVSGLGAAGSPQAGANDPGADVRAALRSSEATLHEAAAAARSARTGLDAAADSAASAAALTTELSATMRALGAALRIQILGAQPFAPIAPSFDSVADEAAALATDLAAVQGAVGVSASEIAVLADRMDDLAVDVGRLRASTDSALDAALGGLDGLRLVATGLLLWIGVAALACLWAGARRLVLTDPAVIETIDPRPPSATLPPG